MSFSLGSFGLLCAEVPLLPYKQDITVGSSGLPGPDVAHGVYTQACKVGGVPRVGKGVYGRWGI